MCLGLRNKIDTLDNKAELTSLSPTKVEERNNFIKLLANFKHRKEEPYRYRFLGTGYQHRFRYRVLTSVLVPESRSVRYRSFTIEEIKATVWDYDSCKAPGPNGFTFVFFKKHLVTLKHDVVSYVKEFEVAALILRECNSSFITLVPKVDDPLVVGNFCLTSLIGSQYKILANRLSQVVSSVVGDVQMPYINGRQIIDGPLMVDEIIAWAKKYKKRVMFLKVDFEKAFDPLSWSFLFCVLEQIGFSYKWRTWIHSCLDSNFASLLVNGSPTKKFKMQRGLRQGDPISPFLFILAIEALNVALLEETNMNIFCGIKVGKDKIHISCLQFIDYALIMGEMATRVNLDQSGVNLDSMRCPIYDDVIETEVHLFVDCKIAIDTWIYVLNWWRIQDVSQLADDSLLEAKFSRFFDALIQTTIWSLWRLGTMIFFSTTLKAYLLIGLHLRAHFQYVIYIVDSFTQDTVMSSDEASFGVIYTSISSDYEELSDVGSLRIVIYGYDGLPMHPVEPSSPDYMPGPEEPEQTPLSPDYVLGPEYPKYLAPSYEEVPVKDKPYVAADLPIALSSGYITESDPKEDPEEEDDEDHEEDPDDYLTDRDDDDEEESSEGNADDEEEDEGKDEEEEHLAPADSVPPPTYCTTARMFIRAQTPIPFPSEADVNRILAIPTPPSSPLTPLSSPLPRIPSPPFFVPSPLTSYSSPLP
nr:cysteine-rich receptor-like protein kinase [Tanacetum cinerariifolium]